MVHPRDRMLALAAPAHCAKGNQSDWFSYAQKVLFAYHSLAGWLAISILPKKFCWQQGRFPTQQCNPVDCALQLCCQPGCHSQSLSGDEHMVYPGLSQQLSQTDVRHITAMAQLRSPAIGTVVQAQWSGPCCGIPFVGHGKVLWGKSFLFLFLVQLGDSPTAWQAWLYLS